MLYLDLFYSLCNHFELGLEGVDYDVEFSDLHRVLSTEYRPNISHVEASRIIKQAFPSATTKRKSKGDSKRTFYLGVRPRHESASGSGTIQSASGSSMIQSCELISSELKSLQLEMTQVLLSDGLLVHGPDTVANFESFSLSSLFAELRQLAPGLVELCLSLGDTNRNVDCDNEDALVDNDIKVLMSVCTLLNARSRQVKGLQLLLGLMLVSRAINKQVSCYSV